MPSRKNRIRELLNDVLGRFLNILRLRKHIDYILQRKNATHVDTFLLETQEFPSIQPNLQVLL